MAIGMSVPGASNLLGNNSSSVADQVMGETEEQRKKRMAQLEENKLLPTVGASSISSGYGTALGGL